MEDSPLNKAKTLDGSRTRVDELNTAVPEALQGKQVGLLARIAAFYRNLSLVMAGMYTGLNCYGTPHDRHSYDDENGEGPDRRPL